MSSEKNISDLGVVGSGKALVTFKDESAKPAKTPVIKTYGQTDLAFWGDDNLFPQGVLKDIKKVTELSSGLNWKIKALVSGGLVYGHTEIKDGEEKFVRGYSKAGEAWNARTNIPRYCRDHAQEFYTLWNGFTRMTQTNDGKIFSIDMQESAFTRLGLQNKSNGKIDKAFVCANWDTVSSISDDTVLKYPVIDPYIDAIGQYESNKKDLRQFIYPTAGNDSGYTYYATAPWNSVRESGWIDVVKAIPSFKKALLKNQYTIKYHFEVSRKYLLFLHPNYESLNDSEKIEIKKQVLDMLDKKFKGHEEAGKNILSLCDSDPNTGEMYPGLKITAIDDKVKDGIYIEDSQEGAMHIYNALELHSTLANTLPGRSLGGGSGSDQRVAYNIHKENSKSEADTIIEPIVFSWKVNGFTQEFEEKGIFTMMFKNYWMATQDQSKTPMKEPQQQAK